MAVVPEKKMKKSGACSALLLEKRQEVKYGWSVRTSSVYQKNAPPYPAEEQFVKLVDDTEGVAKSTYTPPPP